jgi:acetoin utilization deacetylase AcuC-like enzyme
VKIFFTDGIALPLPEGHQFRADKYTLLLERLIEAGLTTSGELTPSEPATNEHLYLVHNPDYVANVLNGKLTDKETRRIGFPWSPHLVERSKRSVGGTIAACRAAVEEGTSANLGGGTHHAYPDHGEGYCVFNDVAIAARTMQVERRAHRIVILDCDVHQGNGTAAIFASDPTVFTFSIHGEKNFPFHKEHSDMDIALPDGSGDEIYLEALQHGVQSAIDLANAGLAVYIAGADPFAGDRLGRLALTKGGLEERDRQVLDACQRAGLPVAIVLGGGYARKVEDIIDIHLQTIRQAVERAHHDHLQ